MVGPARSNPSPAGGPMARARSSAATTGATSRGRSRPSQAAGHVGTAHPASASRIHHSATVRSGSHASATKARTAAPTVSAVGSGIGAGGRVEELEDALGGSGDEPAAVADDDRALHELGVIEQQGHDRRAVLVAGRVEPERLEPVVAADELGGRLVD